MLRNNIVLALFLGLCSLVSALGAGLESTITQVFRGPHGALVTPKNDRRTLILFWAGWCVPCKEELSLIARSKDRLKDWTIIAINVDDSAGATRADSVLAGLAWPHQALKDESGSFFYQVNPSGELPLALVFDGNGNLLEVLHEINHETLIRLSHPKVKETPQESHRWDLYTQSQFIHRNRAHGSSEVSASTASLRYHDSLWKSEATYDLIRQKRDPDRGWQRFEDDLGSTFLEWRSPTAKLFRVRAGDDSVEWNQGQLISARPLPGTQTNSSLLGAHLEWGNDLLSLSATGGRVREHLYGLVLDPTIDLTQNIPKETAVGAIASARLPLDSVTFRPTLGALGYRREAQSSFGSAYFVPYEDRRLSYGLGLTHESFKLDWNHTRSEILSSQIPNLNSTYVFQGDAIGFFKLGSDTSAQLSASLIGVRYPMPRTFVPMLTEYPAIPLSLNRYHVTRALPRLTLKNWLLDASWIKEVSDDPTDVETQNTYATSALFPPQELKATLTHQNHDSVPLNSNSLFWATQLGTRLHSAFYGLIEWKSYRSQTRTLHTPIESGKSFSVQASTKIEKLLGTPSLGQMTFSVTQTFQNGYFYSTSGISKSSLTGLRLSWLKEPFEIRVSGLQEPGGVVCSAGICSQRPPVDGFSVDALLRWVL